MISATLRQLEYFVAAAQTGTVSAAANQCMASQAAVSTALNELEKALGVQLFVRRTAKGVRLTPSGERMFPIARRILGDAQELHDLAGAELTDVTGPLHIACTMALSPRVLPALVQEFTLKHPKVDLTLSDGLATSVQEMVLSGQADACLLYRRQLEADLEPVTIRQITPYVVLSTQHRYASREHISLHELAQDPLILVNPEGSRGAIESIFAEAGVTPRVAWSLSNPETVRSIVARNLGYSVFSGRPASMETFDGGKVTYVSISDPITPNDVVLARPKNQQQTARMDALLQLLHSTEVKNTFG